MGCRFGIVGLRNTVMDTLHRYYDVDTDDGKKHMSPDLCDVQYVYDNTKPAAPIRAFLLANALFWLFSKKRATGSLPPDWVDVLRSNGDIGFEMIDMLAGWGWVIGKSTPIMKIKPRHEFHERVPEHEIVKQEPADDNA